jgi:hypothetical protein
MPDFLEPGGVGGVPPGSFDPAGFAGFPSAIKWPLTIGEARW